MPRQKPQKKKSVQSFVPGFDSEPPRRVAKCCAIVSIVALIAVGAMNMKDPIMLFSIACVVMGACICFIEVPYCVGIISRNRPGEILMMVCQQFTVKAILYLGCAALIWYSASVDVTVLLVGALFLTITSFVYFYAIFKDEESPCGPGNRRHFIVVVKEKCTPPCFRPSGVRPLVDEDDEDAMERGEKRIRFQKPLEFVPPPKSVTLHDVFIDDAPVQARAPVFVTDDTPELLLSVRCFQVSDGAFFEFSVLHGRNIFVEENGQSFVCTTFVEVQPKMGDGTLLPPKNSKQFSDSLNPEYASKFSYQIPNMSSYPKTVRVDIKDVDAKNRSSVLASTNIDIPTLMGSPSGSAEERWYPVPRSLAKQAATASSITLNVPGAIENPIPPWERVEFLKAETGLFGEIELSFNFVANSKTLTVGVETARNLPAADSNGFSDPYVKIHLYPEFNSGDKKKTKVIKETLSPTFHESFQFIISHPELPHKMVFTVMDHNKMMGNTFLGEFVKELSFESDFSIERTWYTLQQKNTDIEIWNTTILKSMGVAASGGSRTGLNIFGGGKGMKKSPSSVSVAEESSEAPMVMVTSAESPADGALRPGYAASRASSVFTTQTATSIFAGPKKGDSGPSSQSITAAVATSSQLLDNAGEIKLMLKKTGSKLTVVVDSARKLIGVDSNGASDPYVKIRFTGDSASKKKTKVKKATLAPTWNETFELDIVDPHKPLDVQVMDHNAIQSNVAIGRCTIHLKQYGDGDFTVNEWFPLSKV